MKDIKPSLWTLLVSYYLLYNCTLFALGLETISATDSRINYSGTWVVQNGGQYKYSADSSSSALVSFKGSAVYWYGAQEFRGGSASVSVDGGDVTTVDASEGTTENGGTSIVPLYSKTGLDGSQTHTLLIQYKGEGSSGGIYITLYHIDFDTSSGSASVTPSTTITTTIFGSSTQAASGSSTGSSSIADGTRPTIQSDTFSSSQKTVETSPSTSPISSVSSPSPTILTSPSTPSTPFPSSSSPSVLSQTGKSTLSSPDNTISSPLIQSTLIISGVEIVTTFIPTSTVTSSVSSATDKQSSKLGIILGAVFGSLSALLVIGILIFFLRRRVAKRRATPNEMREGDPSQVVPYLNSLSTPVNSLSKSHGTSGLMQPNPSPLQSTSKGQMSASDPESNSITRVVQLPNQTESGPTQSHSYPTSWTPTTEHVRSNTPPPEYS